LRQLFWGGNNQSRLLQLLVQTLILTPQLRQPGRRFIRLATSLLGSQSGKFPRLLFIY
jgi:hypothetical protein